MVVRNKNEQGRGGEEEEEGGGGGEGRGVWRLDLLHLASRSSRRVRVLTFALPLPTTTTTMTVSPLLFGGREPDDSPSYAMVARCWARSSSPRAILSVYDIQTLDYFRDLPYVSTRASASPFDR